MRYTQKIYDDLIRKIKKTYGIRVNSINANWTISKSNCHFIQQSVTIGTRGYKYVIIGALAHELGHCLTVREGKSHGIGLSLKKNLGFKISKKECKLLLQEEKHAWNYGFKFLRENGIEVGKDLLYLKRVCLRSYSF